MSITQDNGFSLNGEDLRYMILEAYDYFEGYKEAINDLNVFPVPDGDTGTNMSLTLKAAAVELYNLHSDSIGEVARVAARSSLLGARGNSGVIFSQLFRGIARGLSGKDEANLNEMGRAFQYGIVYAYNAVSKPVSGTILTVARDIAKGSREAMRSSLDFSELMQTALQCGKEALDRTPELLPALKDAGVVDAGGLGLIVFLEGCLKSMINKKEHPGEQGAYEFGSALRGAGGRPPGDNERFRDKDGNFSREAIVDLAEDFDERYPYCTEFLIQGSGLSVGKIRGELESFGNSIVVAGEEDLVKVHIHTGNPGHILQICLQKGSLHDIKIDNMSDQFQKTRWSGSGAGKEQEGGEGASDDDKAAIEGEIGIVTISSGDGLAKVFTSLGAHKIIAGGQSMNPSVDDIVKAVQSLPAEMVIILPNNKNIKLAAEQAVKLLEKEVVVIDARSLPQGIVALLAFDQTATLLQNYTEMCLRAKQVKTGEVTFAVRDAVVNNIQIKKNEIIGLFDGDLIAKGETVNGTTAELIDKMLTGDEEIITFFYGEDVKAEQAEELAEEIGRNHPSLEVELHYGGQPLYYYLFSLE